MKHERFLNLTLIICLSLSGCVQRYYNVATQKEEVYFYSSEKEVKIGQILAQTVEDKFKVNNDLLIQQQVNIVGQRIASVSERKNIKYYFKVLDKKDVNAFALPGGYVYILIELWNKIELEEDMIAAVLAHEIAHISARHSIKRLQNSIGYGTLAILINTSKGMDSISKQKAMVGINKLLLSYSRQEELEADVLAVNYLKKAGYNPKAILKVLKILQKTERKRPIRPLQMATHPYITERVKAVKEQIDRGNIGFDDYINTIK